MVISNKTIFFKEQHVVLENAEIVNGDWNDDYGVVVLFQENKTFNIFFNNQTIPLNLDLDYPVIRWVNEDTFVVANPRTNAEEDNIFLIDRKGNVLSSFHAGDAIEDIEVAKEGIWVSYFDEGIFDLGISSEGLILFDFNGEVLFRYHSDLLKREEIDDCYAMCKGKGDTVWIFPYMEFPLVQVFPEKRETKSFPVPKKIHGSQAVCVRGKYAYFANSRNSGSQELLAWEIQTRNIQSLGVVEGDLRGLGNNKDCHFISVTAEGIELIAIHNEEEYSY